MITLCQQHIETKVLPCAFYVEQGCLQEIKQCFKYRSWSQDSGSYRMCFSIIDIAAPGCPRAIPCLIPLQSPAEGLMRWVTFRFHAVTNPDMLDLLKSTMFIVQETKNKIDFNGFHATPTSMDACYESSTFPVQIKLQHCYDRIFDNSREAPCFDHETGILVTAIPDSSVPFI